MASRRGWVRGAGCLLVLVLLAAGVWLARGSLLGWAERFDFGAASEPSESVARAAEEKLDRLAREGLTDTMRLSEVELQSLLTHRVGPALPEGMEDLRVAVEDSIILLSARVRPDDLEGFTAPESLGAVLDDTTRIVTGVEPEITSPGEGRVTVRSLQIGDFAVPPVMLPMLLRGLEREGVRTERGAVVVPLPRSVEALRIEGEDLLFVPGSRRD